MKTKIIPFDLEMAKKIQAGEAEGKIKYTEDDSHVYNAEIIKFDLIADKLLDFSKLNEYDIRENND